jgi:hypothetical protein
MISVLAGMVLVAHRKNLLEEFTLAAGSRTVETKTDHSTK